MIDAQDISAALRGLGLDGGPLLVHSDLSRCLGVRGRTRQDKLQTVVDGLEHAQNGGALLLPAFTYSYCRGEDYDPLRSPSMVGLMGEWARGLHGSRRTLDPIYSVVVRGSLPAAWERRLFAVADTDCFGPRSVFAYLREVNARILFLGVEPTANTFVHHLEQVLGVGYRYFKTFTGAIVTPAGRRPTRARFFVRDLEADVETHLAPLVDSLKRVGGAASTRLHRGPRLTMTSAGAVEDVVRDELAANRDFLLRRGHAAPTPES